MNGWRISLHRRDGTIRGYALVDRQDVSEIVKYGWFMTADGYAARNEGYGRKNRTVVRMHRQILGLRPKDGLEVDHINGDPLDNRRANLRIVDRAQQVQNVRPRQNGTSRFRGVDFHAASGLWRVRVRVGGNEYSCYRKTEDEAGAAAVELRRQHMTHAVDR